VSHSAVPFRWLGPGGPLLGRLACPRAGGPSSRGEIRLGPFSLATADPILGTRGASHIDGIPTVKVLKLADMSDSARLAHRPVVSMPVSGIVPVRQYSWR
jgi:hypothetical protein